MRDDHTKAEKKDGRNNPKEDKNRPEIIDEIMASAFLRRLLV